MSNPTTNVTGLPRTGFVDTNIVTMTKEAVRQIETDPILLRFRKNDQSFQQSLIAGEVFQKGAVANIQVAPVFTAGLSSNVTDSVNFQEGSFSQIPVTLDYIAHVGWTDRQIQSITTNLDIAKEYGASAGTAIINTMYDKVISMVVNNSYVGSDQKVGNVGTPINDALLREVRVRMNKQHGIDFGTKVYAIINADAYGAMLGIDRYTTNPYFGNDGAIIRTGLLDTLYNIEFFADREFGDNGGNSQSVSGSAGAIGVILTQDSFVMPTRQLGVYDTGNQYAVNVSGISLTYTQGFSHSTVGGVIREAKLETLFGIQSLAKPRKDTGAINGTIYPLLGGI